MTDILELPFDQYQRYGLVRALLESVRQKGETFRILDVGGRTALLREFLPDDRVELVDVDPSDVPGLVLGSGAQLPFGDDTFDAVCAFDTLEHVPVEIRDRFVAECGRVAKNYVLLAGPYDAPRVAEAEEILLEFLKVQLNWEHRYLAEHRENGLPDAEATESILKKAGASVSKVGHGALDRWLLLMCLELYAEHQCLLHELMPRVYRLYNEQLFASDHGPEVYRHAIIGVFGNAPVPNLDGVLEPPGSAPREASQILRGLGQELLRYDTLRDTYEPEMKRLHGVVKDVSSDIKGHDKTIEKLEEDLRGHKATLNKLRAEMQHERKVAGEQAADRDEKVGAISLDLQGHKDEINVLKQDLAGHQEQVAILTADLEGHRAAASELQKDLSEHKKMVATLQSELQEERKQSQKVIETFSADLEGHKAALKDLSAQREAELQELANLTASVDEREKTIQRVHSNLDQALQQVSHLDAFKQQVRQELKSTQHQQVSLESAKATLEEEVSMLIKVRDKRLEERDEARNQVEALQAQLVEASEKLQQEQERRATLAAEVNRLGGRLIRKVTFRKLDPDLLD